LAANAAPPPNASPHHYRAELANEIELSHPRSVAEQLATRTTGGQEKSAAHDGNTTQSGTATVHGDVVDAFLRKAHHRHLGVGGDSYSH